MRPRIGYNLLTWSAGMGEDLFPISERLKKIGYDGVECFMAERDKGAYTKLGKHLNQLGLEATTVLGVGPEDNPASPSPSIRSAALDRLKEAIDCAHALQSKVICGPFHSAFATFTREPGTEQELAHSAEVMHAAGDYAAQAGVTLTPEALNRFECYLINTMDQLSSYLKRVNHTSVRAMFDTHHGNIEEKKLSTAIRTIAPFLHHVHISENDRGTPGDGHVQFEEAFSALAEIKYKGWLTIEAFTRNDPGFANAINVWREYSKPWDMAERGFELISKMVEKYKL